MAYTAIQIEGALFPADLLDAIATGDAPGQRDQDFDLPSGVRLTDEIQLAFSEIRKHWDSFQARLGRSTESPTTLTREHWIIPLFETLGVPLSFQRAGLPVGEDSFVISHLAGTEPEASPVHVVGLGQSLDRRADGSRRSPHATVQEYLNRSDAVWGIVTSGDHLRVLRDAQALARPSYLQFDLRAMVQGNLYSEFVLLFRLLHHTRWTARPVGAEGWLERYYQDGIDVGGRVREHLRDGVEEALRRLGAAFLAHPESTGLRDAIENGTLDATGYYRELLRLIYRFLFLLVVEDRKLLFTPTENPAESLAQHDIYTRYYSMARLRDRCQRRFEDDEYADLWEGMKQSFLLFREQDRAGTLGLAALNGELFGAQACAHIEQAHCANVDLLTAILHLSTFDDRRVRRRVNYAALDVEELGSVYESLLDFHPLVELEPRPRFDLVTGSERKQTGSYYTPPSLVAELIKSALVPVMTEKLAAAATWKAKEAALLDLRVVDPASGSGHFLLAAARSIARELARVRLQGDEPSPVEYRQALRDVVRTCIYAVDKNPLAVDLCKVALWIEGYNAGMPLSFLDNHIKWGDSLVGVRDIGVLPVIPEGAYAPVTGDDRALAGQYRKLNRTAGEQYSVFGAAGIDLQQHAADFRSLGLAEERTPYQVHQKEKAYEQLRSGGDWWDDRVACDLWTAAFFLPIRPGCELPTSSTVEDYLANPRSASGQLVAAAVGVSQKHPFFHWPLEFPDVVARGGFDVVLGNPPWERIKLQEEEFFAARDPEIAHAQNKSARGKLIATLPERNPALATEFEAARHDAEAQSKFIRASGRFPLCGRGDVNTYSIFAETSRSLLRAAGRAGYIVPSGIATDDTTKYFFADLMEKRALVSLYDFENREAIFSGVHRSYKFCLLTLSSGQQPESAAADFAFFLHNTEQLRDPERRFALSAEDMALLNPNTRTCPIFRSRRDAAITKAIYRRVPVLIKEGAQEENPWGISFVRMFDMSNDSGFFRTRTELEAEGWELQGNVFRRGEARYLPLYEAKMLHQFDHRWATYDGLETRDVTEGEKTDPHCVALPRYWVPEREVARGNRLQQHWLLAFRRVARTTDERSAIFTALPIVGAGDSIFLSFPSRCEPTSAAAHLSNLNSFAFDFVTRQKVGGMNFSFFIVNQLPALTPASLEVYAPWAPAKLLREWLSLRVLELLYIAWDMQPFARDLGYSGPPFASNPERRFQLRCELDAAFFHLYGIERDDVDYIMETFPIVKRKDQAKWGEYRTKRVILEMYDAMRRAMETGEAYGDASCSVQRRAL